VSNSVLLPNQTVLVIGGELGSHQLGCSEIPALVPELYEGGGWNPLTPGTITRDYHSTALLLDDGSVLTGGGNYRRLLPEMSCSNPLKIPITGLGDYQVFAPPYLTTANPKPLLVSPCSGPESSCPAMTVQHGGLYTVQYAPLPLGVSIQSVVLMRAGSVTHHLDPNQRCVELVFQHLPPPGEDPTLLQIAIPAQSELLPKGDYMLFLLSNQGVPSTAAWVKVT
jgi:galactose oxidase